MSDLFKKIILSIIISLPSLSLGSQFVDNDDIGKESLLFSHSLEPNLYDFSAPCSSGQTLYYSLTSDSTVQVVPPAGYSWSGYTMPTGELVIPETVIHDGVLYKIESIGRNAFFYCDGLTGVVIPNSVFSIGNQAFCHCEGLASLTLSESLEIFGDSSFFYCNHLQSLVIPNSVTEIGRWAFGYCDALPSVTIGSSVSLIKQNAFPTPLQSVVSLNHEAPLWSGSPFQWNSTSTPIYIPIGSLASYQSRWTRFYLFIETDFSQPDSAANECLDSCTYKVVGHDSYGDGWNGGQLTVMQNSLPVLTFTIVDGGVDSCSFKVCKSGAISIVWYQGSWNEEVSFSIYDEESTMVYSTYGPPSGLLHTMTPNCSDCHIPQAVTTTVNRDSVFVTWEPGNEGMWNVAIGPFGSNPDDLTIYQVNEPSFAMGNLANGAWNVFVRVQCSDENSNWVATSFFVGEYLMPPTGTDTLFTCNMVIFDDGGPNGNYSNNSNSTLFIFPEDSTKALRVEGTSYTEGTNDYLRIYDGIGTNGTCIFDDYGLNEQRNIGPYTSDGPVTIVFHSDGSVIYSGYQINVSCTDKPCQTTLSMYSNHYIGGWGDYRGSLSLFKYGGQEIGTYQIANSPAQSFTTSFRQDWDSIRLVWNHGSCDDGDRFLLKDNLGVVRYTVMTNGQSNMNISDTRGNSWNNVNNITLPMSCSDSTTVLHHITFSEVQYGDLTINGFDYSNWDYVLDSSIITIAATPGNNSELQYLKVNGEIVASPFSMTVTSDVSVEVSFIVNLPELHVTNLTCSDLVSGHDFSVSWTVQNDGTQPTPVGTAWQDKLYLSTVPYLDQNSIADAELIGTYDNISALDTGESYTRTINATLPERHGTGTYYLIVVSDANYAYDIEWPNNTMPSSYNPPPYIKAKSYYWSDYENIAEISELGTYATDDSYDDIYYHDNFSIKAVQIALPPLPDLEVTDIIHPTTFYSGTQVSVKATITNTGEAMTLSDGWRDVLYISSSPDFSSSALQLASLWHNAAASLAPDSSYMVTFTGTVPLTWYGEAYFFVTTDHDDNEYEHVANDNNTSRSNVVNIVLTPPADLVVSDVSMPTVASNQVPLQIGYTVSNEGLGNPNVNNWMDRVYLSTLPTLPAIQFESGGWYLDYSTWQDSSYDDISDTANWCYLLESNYHYDGLAAGQSYSVNHSYTLPSFISRSDTFYIVVVTDVDGQVFEYQSEDNNMTSSNASIISFFFPDLIVDTVIVPDSVDNNHSFTVEYTISNQGLGKAEGPWNNRITMSGSQLAIVVHNSTLMPGDSYSASQEVSLPDFSYSDNREMTVTADYYNSVDEKNAENNNSRSTHTFTTVFKPDLCLSDLTFPDTVSVNHSVDINYMLHNRGKKSFGGQVYYNFYYSTDSVLSFDWIYPVNAIYLSDFQEYTFISAGDSQLVSHTLFFPSDINDGDYYIHVIVDMNDWVSEENEQNNTIYGNSFRISHRPLPDIAVCNVQVPDTLSAGQETVISFDIVNNGETTDLGVADILSSRCYTLLSGNGSWCPVQMQTTPNPVGSITLPVGDTLHYTQTVLISPTLSGNVNFGLKVDASNNIMELNESNNTVSLVRYVNPITFDIEMASLSAPENCTTGDSITISWTVDITDNNDVYILHSRSYTDFTGYANSLNWSLSAAGALWNDHLFLSSDNTISSDDLPLGEKVVYSPENSYSFSITTALPHSFTGNYYLIAVSDYETQVMENDRTNNSLTRTIQSVLAPMPNLTVSAFEMDDVVTQRQGCMIHYTIHNSGSTTAFGPWSDKFYSGSMLLGSKTFDGTLAPGDSYSDSLEVVIPANQLGNYMLIVTTDAYDSVYEHDNEDDNSLSRPIQILQAPPCDLIVTNVEASQNAIVGSSISVNWTVQNIGDNVVSGYVKDGIYLSFDTVFDNSDVMIGSLVYYNSFGVYGSSQHTLDCSVQGVTVGDYHVLVRTNIMRAFNEVSFENNSQHSIATTEITLPTLTIGQSEMVSIASGNQSYYRIIVGPEYVDQTLSLTLSTVVDNAFNGIYLSHESMPSSARFDYGASTPYARTQQILIPALHEGTYYLMAYASTSDNSPQEITLLAEIIDFEILHINTASGTNTGSVTTKVTGAKFDTIMDFRLTDANGYTPAQKVKFENSTNSYVTFNLTDLPAGTYNVEAELPGGVLTVKENAFVVEPGLPAELGVNIVAPSSVRVGNTTTVNIEYGNNGSTDLNVSGFMVVSANGHPIGLTASELSEQHDTVTFSTAEPGMDPDIIRPGYFATKTIFVSASSSGMVSIYVYPIRRRYE